MFAQRASPVFLTFPGAGLWMRAGAGDQPGRRRPLSLEGSGADEERPDPVINRDWTRAVFNSSRLLTGSPPARRGPRSRPPTSPRRAGEAMVVAAGGLNSQRPLRRIHNCVVQPRDVTARAPTPVSAAGGEGSEREMSTGQEIRTRLRLLPPADQAGVEEGSSPAEGVRLVADQVLP